jgi:uncharacterized membrane protein YhaH (DUF805 family)
MGGGIDRTVTFVDDRPTGSAARPDPNRSFRVSAQLNRVGEQAMEDSGGGIVGIIMMLVWLAVLIGIIAGIWKVFTKAGKPGWAALIPIYNIVVLLQIVGRPIWWIVLFLIPIVSIVIAIIVSIDMAKSFGKGTGFGIGLALLGFIFYPMLGFGDAKYQGPAAASGS